jgi:hypothetical protein
MASLFFGADDGIDFPVYKLFFFVDYTRTIIDGHLVWYHDFFASDSPFAVFEAMPAMFTQSSA